MKTSFGLLLFAVGAIALAMGIMQRIDGEVSFTGRSERKRPITQADQPELFATITWNEIGLGALLAIAGLGLAWQSSKKPQADVPPAAPTDKT